MKRLLADIALVTFAEFCALLCIKLKETKSDEAPDIAFWGCARSPTSSDNFAHSARLGATKRTARLVVTDHFAETKSADRQELGKMVGRPISSQTTHLGKSARAQLRPPLQGAPPKILVQKTNPGGIEQPLLTTPPLSSMDSRCLPGRPPRRIRWVANTDSTSSASILRALLSDTSAETTAAHTCWASRSPSNWDYLFRRTARILGPELLATIASIEDFDRQRPSICLRLYVDNSNAVSSIARGGSTADIVAIMAARIWETLQRYNIHDWFSMVRSNLNPSDVPTRPKIHPYPITTHSRSRRIGELFTRPRMALHLPSTNPRNSVIGMKRVRKPTKGAIRRR